MRSWAWLALGVAVAAATVAHGASYDVLRNLSAPAPIDVARLPAGSEPRPVQLARIVVQPRNGEAWALAYPTVMGTVQLLTWDVGRVEAQTASFQRVFDEELQKAGFAGDAVQSLFAEGGSSADLKVGALIDDIQGRFCTDCPNMFVRKSIPATVVMTAKWEVYSSLERKVVARITTTGGADFKTPLGDSILPPIYEGFRENVRLLLANAEFRALVTRPTAGSRADGTSLSTIQIASGSAHLGLSRASSAVVVVFAADGSGSGFLISADGYLLTNEHVVGGSKYVKLKWSDGSESLGEVIRGDARRDVALVKTDARGRPALDLRTGSIQQGAIVYAIGSPMGETLQNTMTKGIVSALRTMEGQPFIQSDVGVTHGNSGGPLLDEQGAVVGMTVSGMAPNGSPVGLNFFIPIDDALRALRVTSTAPTAAAVALPRRRASGGGQGRGAARPPRP